MYLKDVCPSTLQYSIIRSQQQCNSNLASLLCQQTSQTFLIIGPQTFIYMYNVCTTTCSYFMLLPLPKVYICNTFLLLLRETLIKWKFVFLWCANFGASHFATVTISPSPKIQITNTCVRWLHKISNLKACMCVVLEPLTTINYMQLVVLISAGVKELIN